MSGPYDIFAVGYACIDYITVIDRLPALDEKMIVDELLIQGGGPSATAMVAAARLGAKTGIVTPLGQDSLGKEIIAGLEAEGVDASLSPVFAEGRSAFAFVMISRGTGLRTIVGRRPYLPYLLHEHVRLDELRRAKVVFIDGNEPEAQLHAAKAAREAGVPVILDAGNEKEGMEALIPFTDVLIASRGFGRDAAGTDDPALGAKRFFEQGRVKVAAVTCGVEGAYFHTAEGPFHQAAFKVSVADTTGAGDAFHGAYAYAMVRGWEPRRSARFAAAVAALKCMKIGGRTGLPTLAEVESFLASSPSTL